MIKRFLVFLSVFFIGTLLFAEPKAKDIAAGLLKNDSITVKNGKVYIVGDIPNIGELTNEMFKAGIVVSGIANENDSAEEYFLRKMEEG